MPTVSTIPAMPGSVNVACSKDSNATIRIKFAVKAILATAPNTRYQITMNTSTKAKPIMTD